MSIQFILYVSDQQKSTRFYAALLGMEPTLHVPGMTEFTFGNGTKLGLMPENGIAKIITGPLPHPSIGKGVPRCELYLPVEDLNAACARAVAAGAMLVDKAKDREWGHRAAYYADGDGHVIAFACKLSAK